MYKRLRASWLGVMLAVTITFAGCYPFQGDITMLLTPVPVDPTRQAEIQAALAQARAEAVATPETPAEMVAVTARVSANSLRVRQDADPDSPIVAGLRQGDSVQVVGRSEDGVWLQVQIPDVDTTGWVSAEFVTVEGDIAALPLPGAEVVTEQPAPGETPATPAAGSDGTAAAPATDSDSQPAAPAMSLNGDAADLKIVDGILTIPSITSASDGWLVVHADDGGTFGPVIGYAAVSAGENTDVAIPIDTEAATETIHLMLHTDGGVVGTYEFPGADAPVIVDGAPVSMAYLVGAPTMTEVATAPATGGDAAPTPATGGDAAPAPATGGDAAPAPATGGDAAPAPATGSDAAPAPATGSDAAPAPATGGDAAPAPVTGGDAAPAPATSGDAVPATVSEAAMSAGEAAAATGISSAELATVNTRSLRVRSAPSADAEIVGGALAGDVFPVAEKSADGKWVRVYFPGTEGEAWMGSDFVDVSATGLNVKYGNVTVNTGGPRLRVRSAPTLDAEIIGHVYDGDTRYAIGVSPDGKWALLFLPSLTGPAWVSAEYVTYQ